MRLLVMMAQAYFPRQAGGVQSVTKSLVQALRAQGHEVAVAAEMSFRGAAGLRSAAGLVFSGGRFSREVYDAAPVFRARRIANRAGAILSAFRPDCVIVQSMDAMPIAHLVNARGLPLVVCWHDVETHRMGGTPAGLVARYVANSQFTAGVYEREFGVSSAVIPPLIQRGLYDTADTQRNQVTFINPVADKGVELALAIAAACPDISFEFVESWILAPEKKRVLMDRLASLPHVRFTPHQTNMRPVYARTAVLLAPSQWREGWGRVASEAHISGIPVLASRIGGLVESVGPGGMLLPPEAPATAWVEALRKLWDDPVVYAELSAQARKYAQRQELDPAWAVGRMLAEVDAAIALRRAPEARRAA
jgi:glycosyltransferase involved in cell wall biosynthesis